MDQAAEIYVSDTTAITNLAAIKRLDLLKALFRRIVIPTAVKDELTRHGMGTLGAEEVATETWFEVRGVGNQALVRQLRTILDAGESEAVTLAQELNARLLIIDEYKGRQVAEKMSIRIIGVLSILVEAKRRGLVPAVKPIIQQLRDDAGFRLSDNLVFRVLSAVGESR